MYNCGSKIKLSSYLAFLCLPCGIWAARSLVTMTTNSTVLLTTHVRTLLLVSSTEQLYKITSSRQTFFWMNLRNNLRINSECDFSVTTVSVRTRYTSVAILCALDHQAINLIYDVHLIKFNVELLST